jgi:hypothetical protein
VEEKMADPGTPIEQVAALQSYVELLRPLGYRTAEQFVGAARVAKTELSDYLKYDVSQIVKYIPTEIKGKTYLSGELRSFSFGVRLDSMPRRRRAFGVSAPVVGAPSSKNMIDEMPDILDQRFICRPRGNRAPGKKTRELCAHVRAVSLLGVQTKRRDTE